MALTPYDRLTVVLYRTGLAVAAAAELGLVALAAAGRAGGPLATGLMLAACGGIALGILFVHLYLRRFRQILRGLLAAAAAGLAAVAALSGDPLAGYLASPWGALAGGLWVACHAALCLKEAYCFRLLSGVAAAVVAPAVVLAQVGGTGEPRVRLAGALLFAALAAWVAVRKLLQPMGYDIGDKSAYEP
ncbi:MAG: hypothetical protein D6739_06500 [Nitrospirae bacterium]|nr:MAG: hypothetical protein D6739_06500 [Nitrospirota bacterium]